MGRVHEFDWAEIAQRQRYYWPDDGLLDDLALLLLIRLPDMQRLQIIDQRDCGRLCVVTPGFVVPTEVQQFISNCLPQPLEVQYSSMI